MDVWRLPAWPLSRWSRLTCWRAAELGGDGTMMSRPRRSLHQLRANSQQRCSAHLLEMMQHKMRAPTAVVQHTIETSSGLVAIQLLCSLAAAKLGTHRGPWIFIIESSGPSQDQHCCGYGSNKTDAPSLVTGHWSFGPCKDKVARIEPGGGG